MEKRHMDKKYEFTGVKKVVELPDEVVTLRQIRAVKKFGDVEAGELGGWIEGEKNLSQKDNCWVSGEAAVWGEAIVYENAKVRGSAHVSDKAKIYGNSKIYGDVKISQSAQVSGNAHVHGDAKIRDSAWVHGDADVGSNARVEGDAEVYGHAVIAGSASIHDKVKIFDYAAVRGNAQIRYAARVYGEAEVFDEAKVCGRAKVHDRAKICGQAYIKNDAEICGNTRISGTATVDDYLFSGDAEITEGAWHQSAMKEEYDVDRNNRGMEYTVENTDGDIIGISAEGKLGCFRYGATAPTFEKQEHAVAYLDFLEKIGVPVGNAEVVCLGYAKEQEKKEIQESNISRQNRGKSR